MYSQKIINQNLSRIRPYVDYETKGGVQRIYFDLQEVPINEVQQRVDFFNDKIDFDLYEKTVDKGAGNTKIEFKKGWTPSLNELIFMENERILCKYSWLYWSERYYKISDILNRFIQYHANRAQRIWDRIDARLQENGLAIRRGNWKARQQTSTTHSQGKIQHRLQFWSDVKGVTASYDLGATRKMAQMILDSMRRQPYWLRPQITNMVTGQYYYYDNGSRLELGAGTGKQISTGTTPTVVHCSEVPFYLYPNESIIQSLMPSMHDSPNIFCVLEGTANGRGRGNFWFDLWNDCIAGLRDGSYEVYPIFVPNCARDDTYPTESWMKQRADIYANWQPASSTIIYANKIRNYVTTNSDLRDEFGSSWRLSKEKMFWYEKEYAKHLQKGTLHIFLQEFPATPEDMFQNSGMGIYPIEVINYYDGLARQGVPDVYKLRGELGEIDFSLQPTPDEIDDSKPSIQIKSNWDSRSYSEFELVPVKFEGWDKLDPKNKVLIFEHSKDEFEYGIAVDPSDGLGERQSNDAAIEVIRKGTVEHNDKQVCEFTSPEIPQLQLWPFIMAIATYFSPVDQSLLTIEINKGEDAQNAMIARGWYNLFLRKDSTVVSENQNSVRRFGFYTSSRSREALVSHLNSFIKGKWIDINSVKLVEELKDLKKLRLMSNRIKEAGDCDNRFIALGMCLYALHRDEDREFPMWEKRAKQNNNRVIIPTYPNYHQFNTNNSSEVAYNSDFDSNPLNDFVNEYGVSEEFEYWR